ncbi:hypothetical protein AB7303_18735 [Providencia rettgeri]
MNSKKRQKRRKKEFERKLVERCADYLQMRDSRIINRLVQNNAYVER